MFDPEFHNAKILTSVPFSWYHKKGKSKASNIIRTLQTNFLKIFLKTNFKFSIFAIDRSLFKLFFPRGVKAVLLNFKYLIKLWGYTYFHSLLFIFFAFFGGIWTPADSVWQGSGGFLCRLFHTFSTFTFLLSSPWPFAIFMSFELVISVFVVG